jgi:hypothetical protein
MNKINITKRIQEIDTFAESRLLDIIEWEERIDLEKQLEDMDNLEEMYWKHRVGDNWILKGDANTKFFHQFANGRRKNNVAYLKTDNGEIRGLKDITAHVVEFYKKLFGHNDACSLRLGDNFWPSSFTLDEDKADLIKTFELEEIKSILMEMKECFAPDLDGFGANFYKKFWEIIKGV